MMLDQSLILKILELAESASPELPMFPEDAIPGHSELAKVHVKTCWFEGYLKAEDGDMRDGVPWRIIGLTEKGFEELDKRRGSGSL